MIQIKQGLHYRVSPRVFNQFPGYCRGVVLVHDVNNTGQSPELSQMLQDAEESVRGRLQIETIADYPQIKSWRDAYKAFGAKPSEFRSSIEALSRRALQSKPLPSINPLVDIGNIVSLRNIVPVGAHAIDVVAEDLMLRPASGEENFVAFGSTELEHPLPGEIVFVEGNTVITRRWTWRQANHTLTLPETKAVEFNVDGLPPVSIADVERICLEVMELVKSYCGGRLQYHLITEDNPVIPLDA